MIIACFLISKTFSKPALREVHLAIDDDNGDTMKNLKLFDMQRDYDDNAPRDEWKSQDDELKPDCNDGLGGSWLC